MLSLILAVVGVLLLGLATAPAPRARKPAPRRIETPPERPFPLVLPARAGWGTMMDLSMTSVWRRPELGAPIRPDRIIDVG